MVDRHTGFPLCPEILFAVITLILYMNTRVPERITLERTDDGWWVASEEETDIASQGPTREAALDNLDETLEGSAAVLEEEDDAPVPDAPWFDN